MIDFDALKLLQARRVIAAQQAERVRLELSCELRDWRTRDSSAQLLGLRPGTQFIRPFPDTKRARCRRSLNTELVGHHRHA